MPDFKDINSLLNYAKLQVAKAMQDDVARSVRDTIQKYLLSTVYANEQSMYIRSFKFYEH